MTNVNLRNVDRSAKRVALWFEWVSSSVGHLRVGSVYGKADSLIFIEKADSVLA